MEVLVRGIRAIFLSSPCWPIPSMSRGVINCRQLFLSHPFSRISRSTSGQLTETLICAGPHQPNWGRQEQSDLLSINTTLPISTSTISGHESF